MKNNKLNQKNKLIPSTQILFIILLFGFFISKNDLKAQNRPDIFQKANNSVNRITNIISVFQPYLLKARQLFLDSKQMVGDIKNTSRSTFGKNRNQNDNSNYPNNGNNGNYSDPNNNSNSGNYPNPNPTNNGNGTDSNNNYPSQGNSPNGNQSNNYPGQNNYPNGNQSNNYPAQNNYPNGNQGNTNLPNYLPGQNLPINNPSTINNDGTGNLGNQNNGLYGNCLDALTGTVSGMGDAAQNPKSVDLLFFAPADGQNTYTLMTPGFARNNGSAGYMTEHTSEQVNSWTDVNESEVALTKLTLGQFNQIQNNGQISSAVRNAQNYAGYFSSVGQKLDGMVFAIKSQLDDREVYALMAVIKHIGTSGSNGYLKIKIKTTGIDSNKDGYPDAMNYNR